MHVWEGVAGRNMAKCFAVGFHTVQSAVFCSYPYSPLFVHNHLAHAPPMQSVSATLWHKTFENGVYGRQVIQSAKIRTSPQTTLAVFVEAIKRIIGYGERVCGIIGKVLGGVGI